MAAEMYTADNELAEEGHETAAFDRPIIPMYPASSEIQTWTIWNAIRRVLAQLPPQPDARSKSRGDVREGCSPPTRHCARSTCARHRGRHRPAVSD